MPTINIRFTQFFHALLFLAICVTPSLQAGEIEFDIKALSKYGTKKYKVTWIDRSSGSPVEHERGTMTLSATV